MGKRSSAIAALAVAVASLSLVLVAAGCAASGQGSAADSTTADSAVQGDQVKQVTDAYGRVVDVPQTVETAATVGSGARFVVYAGGQDKLIAVTEKETDPGINRPYTMAFADLFKSLPATSNGNHLVETTVNAEALIDLNPDVIISSRSMEECDQLQSTTGIPVIGISYQDQLFTENVYDSIECVGEALGTESHAQEVIAKMQLWEADLTARTKDIPQDARPTVYVGAVNYKGAKGWGGTYADYAPFRILGLPDVADQVAQSGAVDVDLEQLGRWNPDYMFLNAGNRDLLQQGYDSNPAFFQSLKAFQEGHLYTQPFFNFNGTNVDTGICDTYFVGATVYPEAFADVDLDAKYAEIYETMLDGFDFYAVMQQNNMGFKAFPAFE